MSELLEDVLRAATVSDVLRLRGITPPSNLKKLIHCPLHDENTPSFAVQVSNKGYRCHGCDAAGGVIDLMLALGVASTKGDAVNILADMYHIPRDNQPKYRRQERPSITLLPPESEPHLSGEQREQLHNALAGCVSVLSLAGAFGAEYLQSRGLEPDAADVNDVRYHPNWLGYGGAIVFAVRDQRSILVAAQGRYITANPNPKARSIGKIEYGVYATAGALAACDIVGHNRGALGCALMRRLGPSVHRTMRYWEQAVVTPGASLQKCSARD
jgi:CHC2 zinc finger